MFLFYFVFTGTLARFGHFTFYFIFWNWKVKLNEDRLRYFEVDLWNKTKNNQTKQKQNKETTNKRTKKTTNEQTNKKQIEECVNFFINNEILQEWSIGAVLLYFQLEFEVDWKVNDLFTDLVYAN